MHLLSEVVVAFPAVLHFHGYWLRSVMSETYDPFRI
jgi:hypothetical protein